MQLLKPAAMLTTREEAGCCQVLLSSDICPPGVMRNATLQPDM